MYTWNERLSIVAFNVVVLVHLFLPLFGLLLKTICNQFMYSPLVLHIPSRLHGNAERIYY